MTRALATTTPCPASNGESAASSSRADARVGLGPARGGARADRPGGRQQLRRDLVHADDAKAFALEDSRRRRRAGGCRRRETTAPSSGARFNAPQSIRRSANSGRVIAPTKAMSAIARSLSAPNILPIWPMCAQTCGNASIAGSDEPTTPTRKGGRPPACAARATSRGKPPPPHRMASGRVSPRSLKRRLPCRRAARKSRDRRPRAGTRRSAARPPDGETPPRRLRRAP